jgi:hypothetical protein
MSLALQPTILPRRRIGRAIVACSSALAIYTRSLASASIFLEIFDRLSDGFLGDDGDTGVRPPMSLSSLKAILQDITGSAPADMPRFALFSLYMKLALIMWRQRRILHNLRNRTERRLSQEAQYGTAIFPDMEDMENEFMVCISRTLSSMHEVANEPPHEAPKYGFCGHR